MFRAEDGVADPEVQRAMTAFFDQSEPDRRDARQPVPPESAQIASQERRQASSRVPRSASS